MSNKIQTRFGEIEFSKEQIVTFPEGFIGMPELNEYIVVPVGDGSTFNWMQSIQDPSIAFIVTDPTQFFNNYRAIPSTDECDVLKVSAEDTLHTLATVTIRDNQITLNLAAPIFLNPEKQIALQAYADNFSEYFRTPLAMNSVGGKTEIPKMTANQSC